MSELLSPSAYELEFLHGALTIEQLFNGSVPKMPGSRYDVPENRYTSLASDINIQIARVSGPDITHPTWMGTTSPVDALELNSMLYYVAQVDYGLDSYDIIGDGRSLYSNQPGQPARRKRHESKVQGFQEFSESRERILAFFERSFSETDYSLHANPVDTMSGYFAWEEIDGFVRLLQVPQKHPVVRRLSELNPFYAVPRIMYDNTVGMVTLAAFSPETTKTWGDRLYYTDKSQDQRHGTLQALVTPWGNRESLAGGFVLSQLQTLATTGSIDTTRTTDDQTPGGPFDPEDSV